MASIENRSGIVVSVKHRDDLTRTFAHNRKGELKAYSAELKSQGFKPKLQLKNDRYVIRVREAGGIPQCIYASSEQEAIDIKQRVESERRNGVFIDYAKARRVTFADLLVRYLREEAPRHKGFETEGYIINAILADAGLERVDLADAFKAHKNPHPALTSKDFSRKSGKSVRLPSPATRFIRKAFADVVPEDITDYIDDRCQGVLPSTVDREVDLFSATCSLAINTWRIPVPKSPMDGVRRPKYFNERDRRLKDGEEQRLLAAAYDEDAQKSIGSCLEALMADEREQSETAATTYQRKNIVKSARERHTHEAESTYTHVPWMEVFIQFQLMTGARRSETLSLHWTDIDLVKQTASIAESKNGRPRTLPLRKELIALLRQLPNNVGALFPQSVDALRKAWVRICTAAQLVGDDELHVHDLRHEAISRVADLGGLSLVDLQAFSGHRDTRMLLRYTHLCMPSFAKRLDEAFPIDERTTVHRGRQRLRKGASAPFNELVAGSVPQALPSVPAASQREISQDSLEAPSNVLPFRRKIA